MLEVVGAGLGRTGTSSLRAALEMLSYGPCYHMDELVRRPEQLAAWKASLDGSARWAELFQGYRAAVDWPTCAFWRELASQYPDAKFVLGSRDPDSWYDSFRSTVVPVIDAGKTATDRVARAQVEFGREVIALSLGGVALDDRTGVIAAYRRHNEAVIAGLSAERLLIHRAGDGWEPLCRFLGRPVPDRDYPTSNSTEAFRRKLVEGEPP